MSSLFREVRSSRPKKDPVGIREFFINEDEASLDYMRVLRKNALAMIETIDILHAAVWNICKQKHTATLFDAEKDEVTVVIKTSVLRSLNAALDQARKLGS